MARNVASYGAFIDVEHIVGASYFLVRVVPVEPAFADGSVGFGLLVMQVFGFIELFTASEVFVRHIGEVRHRVRICLVGDHVPFGRPCAAGFIAAPPDIFPSEDNGIGGMLAIPCLTSIHLCLNFQNKYIHYHLWIARIYLHNNELSFYRTL